MELRKAPRRRGHEVIGQGEGGVRAGPRDPGRRGGWARLELGCEHSSGRSCAWLSLATGGLWWPDGSKGLTRWSSCSPTSECVSLTAASAAEQRALLGGVPRASGLEPPPCIPVGAVCSPTLLSIPPHGLQRSLCPPRPCTRKCCVGFQSPAPVPHPSECPPPTASRSLSDPRGGTASPAHRWPGPGSLWLGWS